MFDLQKSLEETSDLLEETMDELLPGKTREKTKVISLQSREVEETEAEEDSYGEARVAEAIRYSTLSGGKRLRPFLTLECAGLFGVSKEAAVYSAACIEFIHTYSLIHDDLPAMDDDDMRRGKPSCHKQFDEATAILAGDGLLTLAFEVMANRMVHPDAQVRCELVRTVAKAAGVHGMVGGQMMDLDAENRELDMDEIIRLQRLKTGEMFAVSCETGAILGKAPEQMRNRLSRYAHDMGLAFQITDDLLDVEGTREQTGKAVGKDATAGKATLVELMGVERARDHAESLAEQAKAHLSVFDKKADRLRALADYVVSRRS